MGCGIPYSKAEEVNFFSSKSSYQHETGEERFIEEALDELIFNQLNLKKFRNQDLEQELFRVTRLYFSHIHNDFLQMRNNGLFSENDPTKKHTVVSDFNPKQIDKILFDKTINIVFKNKWKYNLYFNCNIFEILNRSNKENDENDENEDDNDNAKGNAVKKYLEPELLKKFILRVNGKYSEILLQELESRKCLFGYVFIPIRRHYEAYDVIIGQAFDELQSAGYKNTMISVLNETMDKFHQAKEAERERKNNDLRNNERDFEDDYDDDDDLNDLKNFEDEKPKKLFTYEVIAEFIINHELDFIVVDKMLAGVYNYKQTLQIISEMIIRSLLKSEKSITAENLANYFIEMEKAFLKNFKSKDSRINKKGENQKNVNGQNFEDDNDNEDDNDDDDDDDEEEDEKEAGERNNKNPKRKS